MDSNKLTAPRNVIVDVMQVGDDFYDNSYEIILIDYDNQRILLPAPNFTSEKIKDYLNAVADNNSDYAEYIGNNFERLSNDLENKIKTIERYCGKYFFQKYFKIID